MCKYPKSLSLVQISPSKLQAPISYIQLPTWKPSPDTSNFTHIQWVHMRWWYLLHRRVSFQLVPILDDAPPSILLINLGDMHLTLPKCKRCSRTSDLTSWFLSYLAPPTHPLVYISPVSTHSSSFLLMFTVHVYISLPFNATFCPSGQESWLIHFLKSCSSQQSTWQISDI